MNWINVHIPKCAGTTFSGILARNFGDSFGDGRSYLSDRYFKYSSIDIDRIFATYTHLKCFSDHKCSINLNWQESDYMAIAFIRDPVDRFVSHYYYCRQRALDGVVFDEEAARLEIDLYVDEVLYKNPKQDLGNGQCYHLFGESDSDRFRLKIESIDHDRVLLFPVSRFHDACVLLEQSFPDEFRDCAYIVANRRTEDIELSDDTKQKIHEAMGYDFLLYQEVNRVFEERLSNLFPRMESLESARNTLERRCRLLTSEDDIVVKFLRRGKGWLSKLLKNNIIRHPRK